MDLKKYFDNLRELTQSKQITWVRRPNDATLTYDIIFKEQQHTLTVFYDNESIRFYVTQPHPEYAGQALTYKIEGLYKDGEPYKALSKLWDAIIIHVNSKMVDSWFEFLPKLDKKTHFGPGSAEKNQ